MGAFQTAGRPAYGVGPRKEEPEAGKGGSRFSSGRSDLGKVVGIVGALGLGGYYLWSSSSPAGRSGDSTPPEPVPPPPSPSQAPRYCTRFKYFYAPPCTEVHLQEVENRGDRPDPPPPSSTPPLPPPPPRGILKGSKKEQRADRPRPRVQFDLPPEEAQEEGKAAPSTADGLGTDATPSDGQEQQVAGPSCAEEQRPRVYLLRPDRPVQQMEWLIRALRRQKKQQQKQQRAASEPRDKGE